MTRKCVVKVLNLNCEEIDFLCGPKLLPSFTISGSDNMEAVETELEQPPKIDEKSDANSDEMHMANTAEPKTTNEAVASTSGHNESSAPKVKATENEHTADTPPPTKSGPKRKTAESMNYSKLDSAETDGDNTDEYTPSIKSTQPKLDNKKSPSAARMATQKRKHDKPKPIHTPIYNCE